MLTGINNNLMYGFVLSSGQTPSLWSKMLAFFIIKCSSFLKDYTQTSENKILSVNNLSCSRKIPQHLEMPKDNNILIMT
mgnify:CR=1 FL=1